MTYLEMKSIKECRDNVVGFLHITDIKKLNTLFDGVYDVDRQSFDSICDKALELYNAKALSNKIVSRIFEIVSCENSSFRVESHRFESHSIFEYAYGYYLFLKKGTRKEFMLLNHYL